MMVILCKNLRTLTDPEVSFNIDSLKMMAPVWTYFIGLYYLTNVLILNVEKTETQNENSKRISGLDKNPVFWLTGQCFMCGDGATCL